MEIAAKNQSSSISHLYICESWIRLSSMVEIYVLIYYLSFFDIMMKNKYVIMLFIGSLSYFATKISIKLILIGFKCSLTIKIDVKNFITYWIIIIVIHRIDQNYISIVTNWSMPIKHKTMFFSLNSYTHELLLWDKDYQL